MPRNETEGKKKRIIGLGGQLFNEPATEESVQIEKKSGKEREGKDDDGRQRARKKKAGEKEGHGGTEHEEGGILVLLNGKVEPTTKNNHRVQKGGDFQS